MMSRSFRSRLCLVVVAACVNTAAGSDVGGTGSLRQSTASSCPPANFSTVASFDVNAFVAKRWYAQQQMEVLYLPRRQNFCVFAEYTLKKKSTFFGYDVAVHNHAEEEDGTVHDSGPSLLCAKIQDEKTGKLSVAPCFLPSFLAGPYWVVAYDEQEGYALISGGAPSKNGSDGKCKTGSGVNDSGLWIFTRAQKRDESLVQKVRSIATAKGFDVSVLGDVGQEKCGSEGVVV